MNRDYKEITILCEDSDEAFRIGQLIHDQLRGNDNYRESSVMLEFDRSESKVCMIVDPGIDIPDITLSLSKPKD